MDFIELLKVILLGIVEGITEWLPVSSTGHMYLIDEFIPLNMSEAFKEMFFVVIQLGAIFAVILAFFKQLCPVGIKDKKLTVEKDVCCMWLKVVVACIPTAILGFLLDDFERKFGEQRRKELEAQMAKCCTEALVVEECGRVRIPAEKMLVSDYIIAALMVE